MQKDDLFQTRLKKLKELQKRINPYPSVVEKTHTNYEAKDNFKKLKDRNITLAGRLIRLRLMGKACFGNLQDESGDIQVYFKYDNLGKENFIFLKEYIDLGDFLEVSGRLFKTHTGEITLLVEKYRLLVKALRPLPEKWHGLKDVELRHRKRYLDLLANPAVKKTFTTRSKIISTLRKILDEEGFIEVETPILQPLPGGAAAKPFVTHHEALDQDFYLRIAPELYLKKLLIGGLEKIYEIGKAFRNEGVDREHNPEFTIMELYYAYYDFQKLMDFIEDLLIKLLVKINKEAQIEYQGKKIDLKKPFKRITYQAVVKKFSGIDIFKYKDVDSLRRKVQELKIKNIDIPGTPTWPKLVDEIFKETVRANLIQPTFVINHPTPLSPLAKKDFHRPEVVERFQLYIGGLELVNGFSELNDPVDQRQRFEEQAELRKTGDEEAMVKDLEFVEALEYGMPPTAGLGVGIDRLIMLLTNQSSIREIICFPQLRSKE